MAYATSNPPALNVQAIAGPRRWVYTSADAIATVNTTGYITNGDALGMKVGDLVEVIDTATPTTSLAVVASVTAGGACDLTDGTAVTRANAD